MKKILKFLKNLFARTRFYVQQFITPSIHVVEALKAFLDTPAAPILTALIPGHVDDVIADRLRKYLPIVLQALGLVEDIRGKSPEVIIQLALAKLRLLNPDGQNAAWHNIASLLGHYLSDGKLSWSEAIHLAEMSYNEFKGKI
jgi:hypothetical protein